jgi:hypothetical protein
MNRRSTFAAVTLTAAFVLPSTAPAADEQQIATAIRAGRQYLESQQAADGSWSLGVSMVSPAPPSRQFTVGMTALCGLALAETGSYRAKGSYRDHALQRAVAFISSQMAVCRETYSLGLIVLLSDRPAGNTRLQSVAAERLILGQRPRGDWGYLCPPTAPAGHVDNSNSQFAVLGLLAARDRSPRIRDALRLAASHFRTSQREDGGWVYGGSGSGAYNTTVSMTCAGLLGIATQHGLEVTMQASGRRPIVPGKTDVSLSQPLTANPLEDPAVVKGLAYVERYLKEYEGCDLTRGTDGVWAYLRPDQPAQPKQLLADMYLLWSIERTAVLYGLSRIGEVDWYQWGADKLNKAQLPDGHWDDMYLEPRVATSFALLFLTRANLTPGLSETIAKKIRDSEQGALRPGGDNSANLIAGRRSELSAETLWQQLEAANEEQRAKLIDQYRDERGTVYSAVLTLAAERFSGRWRDAAREALAARFRRMTVATLRLRLSGDNIEMQLAAVKAAAEEQSRDLTPEVIELLLSKSDTVREAARDALKVLTGENLGPPVGAKTLDYLEAHKRWKVWWLNAQEKTPQPSPQ